MKDIAVIIGKRIRELRHARGISLEELAFKAGINAPHLGQIERGLQNPTLVTLERICTALNTSLSSLFNELNDSSPVPAESTPVISKINAQLQTMSPEQQEDILRIIRIFRKNIKKTAD